MYNRNNFGSHELTDNLSFAITVGIQMEVQCECIRKPVYLSVRSQFVHGIKEALIVLLYRVKALSAQSQHVTVRHTLARSTSLALLHQSDFPKERA